MKNFLLVLHGFYIEICNHRTSPKLSFKASRSLYPHPFTSIIDKMKNDIHGGLPGKISRIILALILVTSITANKADAQSMGISSSAITPDASSILELRTTTKGLLIPRMTTTQRDAISSPATGLVIYNSTTSQFNFFDGASWQSITGGSQAQLNGTGFIKANGTTISYDNSTYIQTSEKGANNGVATLDAGGKLPLSQMTVGPQLYKGTWDASTNTPAISDATGQRGDTYRVVVTGTVNLGSGNVTFYANDDAIHNGTIWQRNPATFAVTTVNGQSGTVVLNSDNITEGSTNKYYTDTRANLKVNVSEKGTNNGVATLDASGKIPASQLPVGSQTFKGTWNATTNTPTLANGTGTAGWTYRVAVAGTQNLGAGSVSYSVGDDVIYDGSVWQRSPSAASVTSVNTLTGSVVLTTDNINEGSTNLYFTNARVRSLISANSPLSYNSSSGVFSIPLATSSVSGYLSSTDWVTFNQKQTAGNYLIDPAGNGIVARTALNTTTYRTLTGTSNRLSITNGDGVSGNPTFDISSNYVGQNTITTLGTITTGVWNGTALTSAYLPAATVYNNQANSYSAGMKQTFQESTTTAGLNFAGITSDPSSLVNGDVWHNTTSNVLKYRANGTTRTIANLDESQAFTNKDLSSGTNTFPTFNQSTTGTASKATNLVGGNSTTLLGSIPYQSNTDVTTLLSPNTTSTKKFLTQTGTGTNGASPSWATIAAGDVPTLNQNTTGQAGSVANALTINNSGSGTASGFTFDGSATKTLSYNSIGAGRVDSIRFVNSGVLHTSPAAFALSGQTAVVTQTLANQSAFTFLTRGTGTGVPSFQTIDSTWLSFGGGVHGQYFNDLRYAAIGVVGSVTSVTSADANATVANTTTTPVITIVSAPKLQTTRSIYGNNFDGSANISNANIGVGTGTSLALTSFLNEAKGADIASATTTDIGAATGNYINVTGTTTITGLGTVQAGTRRIVNFTGALTLTYNATSLILPTSANITTIAGDVATFVSLGSGNWKCVVYSRADGSSLTGTGGSAGGDLTGTYPNPTVANLAISNAKIANSTIDLTTKVTGILPSANGGTGNGFTKFSGPATSEKTFTLPNANATVLTDNAAVTVAQGGTGVASTTAYGVVTGGTTSTGAFQNAGTGTTGQALVSNGSSALPTWQTNVNGTLLNVRTITSGTTYTPTSGTTKIVIEMVGGGGGGGGAISQFSAGAGGGSGGYIQKYITGISSSTTYTIAIGTGGTGGIATGGATGSSGTATTFATDASATPASTTFTANGGAGGVGSNSAGTKIVKAGGDGGSCTNGDINRTGNAGSFSESRGNAEYEIAGGGGSSQFGGGGSAVISIGGSTNIAGNNGTGYGAGGSGAYAGNATGAAGGNGSAGAIVIYEYK